MAGLAASAGYLVVLSRFANQSSRTILIRSFFYCLAILTSYWFILLLPAFYATEFLILFRSYRSKRAFKAENDNWIVKSILSVIVLSIPIAMSMLLKSFYIASSAIGIGWNGGLSGEYIVSYSSIHSFIVNLYLGLSSTVASLYLPATTFSIANFIIFAIIGYFVVIGLRSVMVDLDNIDPATLYSVFSLLTALALYASGNIALSPTRHSLILFTSVSAIAARGFAHRKLLIRRFGCKYLIFNFPLGRQSTSKLFLMALSFSFVYFCSFLLIEEIVDRQDSLHDSDIKFMSSARTIYYDEYTNFSIAIAPELRNMKETLVSWPESRQQVIKKSYPSIPGNGDLVLYATNSFRQKDLEVIKSRISSSSRCESSSPIVNVASRISPKIVDSPPSTLTYNATNSFQLYKLTCFQKLPRE